LNLEEYTKIQMYKNLGLSMTKVYGLLDGTISRNNIKKVWNLSEDDFKKIELNTIEYLSSYKDYMIDIIKTTPEIKDANIMYRIKEAFPDFDCARSTFYKYIKKIRIETGYDNYNKNKYRSYRELTPPGYEAQVDFGQYKMIDMYGQNKRVYFFVMVLSFSMMKYVYFSSTPFTTKEANKAHMYAFKYFGGIPETILYDQDRLFVISENYGNIILTSEFEEFVKKMKYSVILCKPADPRTKGRVEQTVGFIKESFLLGRTYTGIDSLNSAALNWLDNYANIKPHYLSGKTPRELFIDESKALKQIPYSINIKNEFYVVHLNTITYMNNIYQVPLGFENEKVMVSVEEDKLVIREIKHDKVLCIHNLCLDKGKRIILTNKNIPESVSEIAIRKYFENKKIVNKFLDKIEESKPRYYYRSCARLYKMTNFYTVNELEEGCKYCIDKKKCTIPELISYLIYKYGESIASKYVSQSLRYTYVKRSIEIKGELSG